MFINQIYDQIVDHQSPWQCAAVHQAIALYNGARIIFGRAFAFRLVIPLASQGGGRGMEDEAGAVLNQHDLKNLEGLGIIENLGCCWSFRVLHIMF